ncbi:uroporphyrinogen-III synthase [Curtobacterium sp. VKM Ac-2865]|uniref:uroporphyrinogen-III synthase n=1 Tax=Curtobacterium sp. VKM Ac-2865 TaxID=2783817 RepID=UPI00188B798E|nr:uroporphyrinogen-III synthase [Curtobacterium sp. VKM Ac-2865]MBF4582476.1 uroporphyrinogen-III synthase [Curtobacterium sp. VKM Ac-2865]
MVLVPRGGAWGDRVAAAARERGLDPVVVPLITTEPPADAADLDRAVGRLVASSTDRRPSSAPSGGDRPDMAGYTWLVVTSATAVTVLAGRVPSLPSGLLVAAVGAATARAARAAGWPVDLVPQDASAAALVTALPDTDGTVLFPRSEIAAPTLVDGLRSRGIAVDDVEAYRTVGTGDEPVALDPPPDAVLVTSGSVASEIARRMTPLDPRTLVACIGPGTADDARSVGLPVHAVAPARSAEALLDAVVEALHQPDPHQEGHS